MLGQSMKWAWNDLDRVTNPCVSERSFWVGLDQFHIRLFHVSYDLSYDPCYSVSKRTRRYGATPTFKTDAAPTLALVWVCWLTVSVRHMWRPVVHRRQGELLFVNQNQVNLHLEKRCKLLRLCPLYYMNRQAWGSKWVLSYKIFQNVSPTIMPLLIAVTQQSRICLCTKK